MKLFQIQTNMFTYTLLKIYLFRGCMKEVIVFTVFSYSILVHIFNPRKVIPCYDEFVFPKRISNTICDLVLQLLYEGLMMY